eukprot:Nk52_evm67s207 gene=Nk52_evmTU67s207
MYAKPNQKAFLNQPAPPGYVPGVGRGATGFTTRSDIGPAQKASARDSTKQQEEGEEEMNDVNYDEFAGYGGNLFAGDPYERDDQEADKIYELIDSRMEERRRDRKEKVIKEELEKYRKERPKIQTQFEDLKRKLGTVDALDWEALPDAGTIRSKKIKSTRPERYTPLPDAIAIGGSGKAETVSSVDAQSGFTTSTGGIMSAYPGAGQKTDLTQIGEARNSMLGVKLDQVSTSVHGQSTVDPQGYLTGLNSVAGRSAEEIGDIKKARLLLKSVITTNPSHGPGWVAAARLEEVAGKLQTARNIITKGCEACPKNADVWLEAIRLDNPENAKHTAARASQRVPMSVDIWCKAFELEKSVKGKRTVLRKALERIPNSVRLWKMAVELEDEDDAKIILGRAVECCPNSVELWLALARLETYENARKVLAEAVNKNPRERIIWINGAMLEEANGNDPSKVIQRAIKSFSNIAEIRRDEWMESAKECEQSDSPQTAQAIVRCVASIGIEEVDRKRIWIDDAKALASDGMFECARALYAHALTIFSSKESVWMYAVELEKEHGKREDFERLLEKATRHCPKAKTMWLMYADEQCNKGNFEKARSILASAFAANPNSEEIWLAASQLEVENNLPDRARILLKEARSNASTARVWMKSAKLEWQLGDLDSCKVLLDEAVKKFPLFDKLWLMSGQLAEKLKDYKTAYSFCVTGTKRCPGSTPLWKFLSALSARFHGINSARAIMERGRIGIQKLVDSVNEAHGFKSPEGDKIASDSKKQKLLNALAEIWDLSVELELKHGNADAAKTILAQGLQKCPNSGVLWTRAILMEPTKAERKSRRRQAAAICAHDANFVLVNAKIFWAERQMSKARVWFENAVKIDSNFGDAWAYYYKFVLAHGTQEEAESVLARCISQEPKYGKLWCDVSKQIENYKLKTGDIIKRVIEKIDPLSWSI